jgi:hypothetical protein
MRKLIIFAMALTSLVFLVDVASARVIVLKVTYTQAQIDIAWTREGGGSTAAEGTVVSDVRRLRAKLNATPPGSALANANTAEQAKSATSGVFCGHLTTARHPAPGRAEKGRHGPVPPIRGDRNLRLLLPIRSGFCRLFR